MWLLQSNKVVGTWNVGTERVLERRLRMKVNIDDMQFGFMSGKGTVDAIFIVRQLQKFMEKRKDLFYAFVDLEKAFDRVPRDVVR